MQHHQFDTGAKAARLLFHTLLGAFGSGGTARNGGAQHSAVSLTTAFCKIPMVTQQDQYLTAEEPMGEWFRQARALEQGNPGRVLDVSLYPMQPWLDVHEAGWAVLITHFPSRATVAFTLQATTCAHAHMCRWFCD